MKTDSATVWYVNSSIVSANPFLESLQLLLWIFFHPSAWRDYIARIAPALEPDFCLFDLTRKRQGLAAIYRLLVAGYLACPLLICSLIGLVHWLVGWSIRDIILLSLSAIMYSLAGGLTLGTMMSVASSVAYSLVIAGAMALLGGDPVGLGLTYALTANITSSVARSVRTSQASYSLGKRAGGTILGVVVAAMTLGVLYGVISGLAIALPNAVRVGGGVDLAVSVAFGLVTGLLVGAMGGVTLAYRMHTWRQGLVTAVVVGLAFSLTYAIMTGANSEVAIYLTAGVAGGLGANNFYALIYTIARRVGGPWAGAVAGTLAISVAWLPLTPFTVLHPVWVWPTLPLIALCAVMGLTLSWWLPVILYPFLAAWNTLLFYADQRRSHNGPSLLRYHSAFWDEHQRLRLVGLDDHLVLVAERNLAETQAAIAYLATTRQRWAAQSAQIELEARRLQRCVDIESIRQIHHHTVAKSLDGPAGSLLSHFGQISLDVDAAQTQGTSYHRRLALRNITDHLGNLLSELTRSNNPYAARFYPIAAHWQQILTQYMDELTVAIEERQEIDNPYIFGVPLGEQQTVFVGRTDIAARIEQLLLDVRRPPLLLYGQRRMGKTSLLRNLGRLLPSTIIPLFVDGEGISGAGDYPSMLYSLARAMARSAEQQRGLVFPPLPRESLATDPFTQFNEWLDQVEQTLAIHKGSQALLTLDEFEALDNVLSRGRFDETDFLRMLRHLVQHRPHFKVLLAGSHLFDEFQRWASYLINVQVVKVSYLEEEEALQLIEHPTTDFALRYEPTASQRVLALTSGHPHLLQLLCYEIVELKNQQPPTKRRLATRADVEAAVPTALSTGELFFAELRNQLGPAAFALAASLARYGEGALIEHDLLPQQIQGLDPNLAVLLRRDVLEPTGKGYRFQVELIRRWFAGESG